MDLHSNFYVIDESHAFESSRLNGIGLERLMSSKIFKSPSPTTSKLIRCGDCRRPVQVIGNLQRCNVCRTENVWR